MQHDPYFKYIAAALITGVLLALLHPSAPAQPKQADRVVAGTAAHTSVKS
ncbi:MAG: hypothetical protein PSW75_01025 [bacterium]|nr:hypothetical protein [bacterium]MDI1337130.1 hypothetical protein [Lacunisphaera sp.]